MYKLLWHYNILDFMSIDFNTLLTCSGNIQKGYFVENPFHNPTHIIDTLQGMHFIIFANNLKKEMKKEHIYAQFLANLIHDFEHPGFTNSFVIWTKHPLAIRYNDISVLENHHLAAAFSLINKEENNIFKMISHE